MNVVHQTVRKYLLHMTDKNNMTQA